MYLIRLFFSFEGRIRRLEMWLGTIGLALGFTVLAAINFVLSGVPIETLDEVQKSDIFRFLFPSGAPWQTSAISTVLLVTFLYCGLALDAKRLHDRNWSAWWLVFFYGVPTLLDYASEFLLQTAERLKSTGSEGVNVFAGLVLFLMVIWAGIALWFFIEFFSSGERAAPTASATIRSAPWRQTRIFP